MKSSTLCRSFLGLLLVAGCEETTPPDDAAVDVALPGDGGADDDAQAPAGLLIDDFEDGDPKPLVGFDWYRYTDSGNGGKSTIVFTGAAGGIAMNGAGFESQRSLEVSYTFDQGTYKYDGFVGFGMSLGDTGQPFDASGWAGVSYTYRGGAHRLRFETSEVTDYDLFGIDLPASASWSTVTLPFKSFAQQGWGKRVSFELAHTLAISFSMKGANGVSETLQLDNLMLVKTAVSTTPDMTIRPPAPPADAVIASVAISNPLQAKAMKYLDRGYNITNWLEQERFSSFKYDEAFVSKLAAAGFKALRLPIDLDNYVATKSGSGDAVSIAVHPDLFTILDSFDLWTRTHGLSLTIDYHQYSTLLDKTDATSLGVAVQLWSKVAEHFAASTREDLFFELLNEPELSFVTSAPPTQTEWTALATKMIAAIRAHDTTHTILFGDVEWYAISALTRRTAPLADTNVIYVVHNYDPFIFTHQGASWADMGSTHDVPYPYSTDRWSQYYADLGFLRTMPSWILSSAQGYYRTGNRSSLRNTFIAAKRWAVTHNVPVICNEFGAYDQSSRLEDRVRYYTDLIDIFEELAIPWQHWFMIMSSSGNVIPEYRTAFHLGS